VNHVSVAGDFNNWSPDSHPLTAEHGVFETVISLKKGKYAYKFVVDGNWITDEAAREFDGDRHGEQNSVVFVGDPAELSALREADILFMPSGSVNEVFVAGSFNGWNPHKDRLTPYGNGYWGIRLILGMGEYPYKLILDGRTWIANPDCETSQPDEFDGSNSVLVVDELNKIIATARGDGKMLTYGIPTRISLEMANPVGPRRVQFRTRAYRNDVETVTLRLNDTDYPMPLYLEDELFEYYRIEVALDDPTAEQRFCFVFKDGNESYYLVNGEITPFYSPNRCFRFVPGKSEVFDVPEWIQRGIIYQIYPDRFCNGDPKRNPDFYEYYYDGMNTLPMEGKKLSWGKSYYHIVEKWDDIDCLKVNPLHPEGKPDWWAFYGGDLPGLNRKLDYLKELGITAIYLNPVFPARSPHRYDAADYLRVDPHLGTNDEFRQFVASCHDAGIRIILDVAFNHTGDTHPAFMDCLEKGPASPYWHWYEFKQWPVPHTSTPGFRAADYYQCWWGMGDLPELDYDLSRPGYLENGIQDIEGAEPNHDVVNHILDVAAFWIGKMDIDGFRLDVPNEVPFWFWEIFRKRVKALKPDAYLVGEIWSNASEWVSPRYFDAVMNYAYFKDPVMRFFIMRKCTAAKFDHDLRPGLLDYPPQAARAMMNLLDSHDTHRFLEAAGGDYRKLRLAVLFQMTYVGTPHIYYGDEVGMMGGKDPDNRRPFDWNYTEDPEKVALREYYRQLIMLRKAHLALSIGEYRPLFTTGRIYAYLRSYQNEHILIILNNEDTDHSPALPNPVPGSTAADLISGQVFPPENGHLTLFVPAMSGSILHLRCE
jgi:glycosidase